MIQVPSDQEISQIGGSLMGNKRSTYGGKPSSHMNPRDLIMQHGDPEKAIAALLAQQERPMMDSNKENYFGGNSRGGFKKERSYNDGYNDTGKSQGAYGGGKRQFGKDRDYNDNQGWDGRN